VSHVIEYIYNIYKAPVSPGSVQQIMPYFRQSQSGIATDDLASTAFYKTTRGPA
jgi:hypothetical protein